jgi:hypothetical protein
MGAVVPVTVTPGLEGGLMRLEGEDPRFGRGPAGTGGINFLHDLVSMRNPGWAGKVRFENSDAGRFRITAPEEYKQGLLDAISAMAFDPVVGAGLTPGYGDFDTSYGGQVYKHYGYQGGPQDAKFQFAPMAGGALTAPPPKPLGIDADWNPILGTWVYKGTGTPVQAGLETEAQTATFAAPAAGTQLPGEAFNYAGGLLGIPIDPRLFALQARYRYGQDAPLLYSYRTPAPPPPEPEPLVQSSSSRRSSGGGSTRAPAPTALSAPDRGEQSYGGLNEGDWGPVDNTREGIQVGRADASRDGFGGADPAGGGAGSAAGGGVGDPGRGDALGNYYHGGRVQGPAGRDRVPINATRGEFIVNTEAARQAGPELEALNRRFQPPAGVPDDRW